jgi:hypothetical protein
VAWFGTRTYVGASWTVARQADMSLAWTEITATNPFPNTVALALLFRDASGAFDPRFFATLTVPAAAQTSFLVRDMTIPNYSTGWFMLTSSPTPIVPSAVISVFRAASSHTEMLNVPIEQLDADGFPVGDGAAQPGAAGTPATGSIQRPLATDLWAPGVFDDEHARAVLEFLRAAESAPGSLDAAEPFKRVVGLLLDDEGEEFRSGIGEPPER